MSLYTYIGHDGPRGGELRKIHRPAHLASLEPIEAEGRIRFAGPLLDPDGNPVGSVIIFEAGSLEEARDIAARDPYVAKGIFERHEVYETRTVFPR